MALIFNSGFRHFLAGSLRKTLINQWAPSLMNTSTAVNVGVTVYSGTMPTPAAIAAAWSAYNSGTGSYLAHYTGIQISQFSQANPLQMSNVPAVPNAVNTGTASWAIVWCGQPSGAQLSSSTLPFANFFVTSVTDTAGTGVVRFANLAFTSGSPKAIADVSISFNL
jgi:hypothetical protein